ncbi:replication restart DNA helicase PriA [Candidatus Gracilibacteria bacterium]|nr:replication restart DNA helicase PriA [Candidatus Gracilibacteria bacterium]NJM87552.1 replication restart DNA helicase PriA [Hydrococcus sp. RU_2_2]NJP19461.1 replication restart DNA helicase PriA [Hydrococcus sp. CRU_1_1]NJQ98655.1 replication restart DNA helicase PriA [Hydrococcus sp. CSU_1_8]
MNKKQIVRCPNCGNHATRHHFTNNQIIETSCPACDYLMVNCSRTGNVLESYAPGIPSS